MGDILFSKGLKLEALEYYNSANINYYLIPIKQRKSDAPWILVNIGNVYYSMKDFGKATTMYEDAIKRFTPLPQKRRDPGLSTCNDNLALLESSKGNVENAIEYAEKSLDIRLEVR